MRDGANIEYLIYLFNGEIYTKTKHISFTLFVNAYNFKYNKKIQILDQKTHFDCNSAWLSGFTDAEGCFTV